MLNEVLNKIGIRRQQKHQTAMETYRDLLARQDQLTDADGQKLESVIEELGYGPDQVENDANAMKRIAELKPLADDFSARQEVRRDALNKLAEYDAIKAQKIGELNAEWHRLDDLAQRSVTAIETSIQSRKEHEKLQKQYPHLIS
ncbi:MAG TPA: hypothetical protein VFE58_09395 [Tepidisphaeraceae bacterium]|jgi:hypothetical protein|nr:hypothetical protein [Tepidisphaeraceae bacterium]